MSTPDLQPIPIETPIGHHRPASVAPAWHTIVLIAAVLAYSAASAVRFNAAHAAPHRIPSYLSTIAIELVMLAWVLFGLRWKKVPFRILLGVNSLRIGSIALDLGIAFLFWAGSMMVLGVTAVMWFAVEALVTHRSIFAVLAGETASQQHRVQTLTQLAPSSAAEIAVWILLCIVAGFVEEAVFRGYLQHQCIAWTRGSAVAGVLIPSLVFGAAHAYEGARSMFLIAVFGAMLGALAFFRRGLRPGIVAHSWHDLAVGLALAFIHPHRIGLP